MSHLDIGENLTDEEAAEISAILDEEGSSGLNDRGWDIIASEHWIHGPLTLSNDDTGGGSGKGSQRAETIAIDTLCGSHHFKWNASSLSPSDIHMLSNNVD
jgi:hypothetical protein